MSLEPCTHGGNRSSTLGFGPKLTMTDPEKSEVTHNCRLSNCVFTNLNYSKKNHVERKTCRNFCVFMSSGQGRWTQAYRTQWIQNRFKSTLYSLLCVILYQHCKRLLWTQGFKKFKTVKHCVYKPWFIVRQRLCLPVAWLKLFNKTWKIVTA